MLRKLIVGTVLLLVFTCGSVTLRAEEPIATFLKELEDRRLFDVALRHVDRMENSPLAPDSFKSEVDYQRGSLLVNSARATKNSSGKQAKLDQAQAAFEKFLNEKPNHPSASLARSQLGNILVERARQLAAKAEGDDKNRAALLKQARDVYEQAYTSLSQSRTELGKQLKSLAGDRDPDAKRQVGSLRTKYVQTYLAVARVLFEQAKTLKGDEKEYKAKLTEAATEFGDVVSKYRQYSASIYALLYQGECYQLMGDHKQALSFFKELTQNPDNTTPVRKLKTQAFTKAIDSWLTSERNQGPSKAISAATSWLKTKRGDEDRDPIWQGLRLALARAYKRKADITKDETNSGRALREAREMASEVARRRGPHQAKAQEFLVSLGGSTQTKEAALVDPGSAANFEEARDAAKQSLDRLKISSATVKILSGQLENISDPGRRAEITANLEEAKEQSEAQSQATLELFERADSLATEDDLDERNSIRYYLAFLNYSQKKYRRAAVIGSFVALHYPDSVAAKECANVALAARQRLYQEADPNARQTQSDAIANLAQLMIARWPGSAADSAMMTLLDVVVSRGDVSQAEEYLNKIPENSPKRANAELRIGQAVWREYLRRLSASSGDEQTEELAQLKERAQQILARGLDRIGAATDESTVRAALSLAQIYVDAGEPKKALDLLNRDGFGALKLIEVNSRWVQKIPALTTEAYKCAIRAHVATAATSGNTAESIDAAQDLLDDLRERMLEQPNGKEKLIPIYISLAKDLERQLSIAAPDDRRALSRGFESFLRGASEGNKDISVQNWVGATFFSLGQGMLQGSKSSPEAQRYFTESAKAYKQVLLMAKSQPDALSPASLMQVQARLGMALRQLGKYNEANDLFAKLLGSQKKSYLNIQVEAAKTLQQWGASGNASAYTKAIVGDKPGKDGRNVIWGWGRIAKLVAKNDQYRDTFHEARYNIALCRYKSALSMAGDKQKQLLKRAKSDITMTEQLFQLGTKIQAKRYETLLKAIQKSLGEQPTGFTAKTG